MGDAQAVLAHVLDMLGPRIDEGDVLAGLHHVRAGIAADRPAPTIAIFLPMLLLPACATPLEGSA